MALSPGTQLGPYEVLAPLGAGGMGEVYRGRDTRLDRPVAIKVLPSHLAQDPELRQRFEREARAVSSLNHPHICTLYDIGRHEGTDYLVMEYLEGETLAARLEKGALPLAQALRCAIEISEALDQAHRQGVVHRDLKPGNVMLTKGGAKLLDFGLAKSVAGAVADPRTVSHATPLTTTGSLVGTFQYMSPEQLEGKEADARSDIFTFGAVLYEMVTGRKAFQANSQASLIAAILEREPAPLSELQPMTPVALERLVKTCLAKDPDERWQTARDLLRELRWLAGESSHSSTVTAIPAAPARRVLQREHIAWALSAVLLLTVIAVVAVSWRRPAAPAATTTRFVVHLPDKVDYGRGITLSPDGRRLVFVGSSEGKSRLWLRSLDSIALQPLAGTEGAAYPFWSPDGDAVAFTADRKLKKIRLAGGAVDTICEAPAAGGGTWSRDGVIVFARTWESNLERVSAAGGAPAPLTQLDPAREEIFHLWPHFLPDGRQYLFLLRDRDNFGIYAGSLDSKDYKRVMALESINDATMVAYVPPGYLFFVRNRALMAQRFDARSLQLSGEPFRLAEGVEIGGPGRASFAVSQNGVLAYRPDADSSKTQPTRFSREGKALESVGPPASYGFLDLSPDGEMLAVAKRETGGLNSIWLTDVRRGTSTRFTSDWFTTVPLWSPDGEAVAFSSARDSPPNLYLKTLAGAEKRLMKSSAQCYASDWSAAGQALVYWCSDNKTKTDIWLLPATSPGAEAGQPVPFLKTAAGELGGRISPDGKWMAFTSDESGRNEVYVTSFPTPGRKWQISTKGGSEPRWRSDTKELFYAQEDRRLMAVPVTFQGGFQAGTPAELFSLGPPASNFPNGSYLPDRDGRRFLVNLEVEKAAPPPIHMVLNWLERNSDPPRRDE